MIPKTEIIYNYEYAKRLYRGSENFEDVWRRIIALGADFEKICEEYDGHILELIEKYTGFGWAEFGDDFVPIYITESRPSFVHPLTLAIDEDPLVMFKDCVYQLVHRNMYFGFKTDELRERCLQLVTDSVMCDLKLQVPKESEWDVRKKTIKEYLK